MSARLYYNGTIVTVDPSRRIILDGAFLVIGGRIRAIGKTHESITWDILPDNVHRVDLQQRIVIPGLINGHVHLIQSLMRGLAEDLELHEWASCAIWPLEVAYRGEDGAVAARLAVAEMLKTGTTCFLEPMLPSSAESKFSDIVQAVGETGIRACMGKLIKIKRSDPTAGIPDSRDEVAHEMSIEKALASHKEFHGSFNDRVHIWMAPETPRGQDLEGFQAVGAACINHGIRVTVHVSEAPKDLELIAQSYKFTPAEFCQHANFTGPHVVLGHMVHLAEKDYAIIRDTKTSIAHNPTSNAKLADGIAPIPRLLEKGVNVCIGTDGAPCNNSHDLFRDMHLAGLIHKGRHCNPNILSSEQILEMATINAARALGLEDQVGSLEVDKKADFVVLSHRGMHAAPYDPAELEAGGLSPSTLLVHSLSGADVDMVVIDGVTLVEDGNLIKLDEEKIKSDARDAISRIREKSGVKAQPFKRGWHYV